MVMPAKSMLTGPMQALDFSMMEMIVSGTGIPVRPTAMPSTIAISTGCSRDFRVSFILVSMQKAPE